MENRIYGRAPARPGLALAVGLTLFVLGASVAIAQAPAHLPELGLDDALARSAGADPSAPGADARVTAAQAGLRQAAARPNPSLGLEAENFTGSGRYSGLDRTEATLSYEQTLERGGKREARLGAARASEEIVRRRREVRRLDLLRDVQSAYAEALATQAELLIAEARYIGAVSAQADVTRRVGAARDPLFAGSRAEATTAQAQIDRDQARAAADDASAALARYWRGEADFSLDLEPFFSVTPPAAAAPPSAADLAVLEAERDLALANVRVEQSRSVTDPTVRAGVRYFRDGGDVAVIVGGSIPLRLHDANRGNIERALAERTAAEADIAAERIVRAREIARLLARLRTAATESERIRAEVIPSALRAVDQVRDGFRRGGFQYANVADAERALAEARARRVAVMRQYHLDLAAYDRLTGRHAALASSNLNAERR